MASNIVRFAEIINVPIASITASYTKMGSPFDHAMRVIHITNNSNGTYMLSFDGITDNIVIASDGFVLYDLTSDQDSNEMFRYEKGSQLWIKSLIAPTVDAELTNAVYAALVYGKGE